MAVQYLYKKTLATMAASMPRPSSSCIPLQIVCRTSCHVYAMIRLSSAYFRFLSALPRPLFLVSNYSIRRKETSQIPPLLDVLHNSCRYWIHTLGRHGPCRRNGYPIEKSEIPSNAIRSLLYPHKCDARSTWRKKRRRHNISTWELHRTVLGTSNTNQIMTSTSIVY